MDIRAKKKSIDNHLQRKTEIKNSFVLTLRLAKTLMRTFEGSLLNQCGRTSQKIINLEKKFNVNVLKLKYSSIAKFQSLIKQYNAKVLTDGKKPTLQGLKQ